MTDQEHVNAIALAAATLNGLVSDAAKAGLSTHISVVEHHRVGSAKFDHIMLDVLRRMAPSADIGGDKVVK